MTRFLNKALAWLRIRVRVRVLAPDQVDELEIERYREQLDRDYLEMMRAVWRGEKKHPADMTFRERHGATREVKMEWGGSGIADVYGAVQGFDALRDSKRGNRSQGAAIGSCSSLNEEARLEIGEMIEIALARRSSNHGYGEAIGEMS
jgi:hypothetical protein